MTGRAGRHALTMAFMFAHDMTLGRTNEAASDYRRLLLAYGSDSSDAAGFERRLRDPAGRTAAGCPRGAGISSGGGHGETAVTSPLAIPVREVVRIVDTHAMVKRWRINDASG